MIYLNAFYVVEMQLLKSGPSWEKVVRGGKNGVKSLSQNPHLYTTHNCLSFHNTLHFNILHTLLLNVQRNRMDTSVFFLIMEMGDILPLSLSLCNRAPVKNETIELSSM